MFTSSKKPKFSLTLTINELSNIPHTSGHVYIEISISDSHSRGLKTSLPSLNPLSKRNSTIATTSEDSVSRKSKRGNDSTESDINGVSSSSSTSSGNVNVRTSERKIHNFKCVFNYTVHCNLKFPYHKKDQSIGHKYLLFRVFYVGEKGPKSDNCSHATELGRCEFDLGAYIDVNYPVSSKYLLQNSKVNSILSLSAHLKPLPSDFDFHTQLHVEDTHHTTTQLSNNKKGSPAEHGNASKNGSLRAPDGSNASNAASSGQRPRAEGSQEANDYLQQRGYYKAETFDDLPGVQGEAYERVILDPIVTNLYRKTLESSWDPDLHVLLKLLPEKIVDDIFSKGKNDNLEKDYEVYRNIANGSASKLNKESEGLFTERSYREDLKSWSVSWV